MPVVRIPTPLRPHAGGLDRVEAAGSTVGEILAHSAPSIRQYASGFLMATSSDAS